MDALIAVPRVEPRWDDVLRRAHERSGAAGVSRRSHAVRRRCLRAGLGLAFALALTIPALAISGRLDFIPGLSNEGTPSDGGALKLFTFAPWQQLLSANEVRLLGTREGLAFYAGGARDGTLCLGTELVDRPRPQPGALACLTGHEFPSAEHPIVDFSPMEVGGAVHGTHVGRLIGFAADGVARVGVVDVEGTFHSVPVINNIYASGKGVLPDVPMRALVAVDGQGRTLFEQPYVP
jgi:hypothetical protein